MEAFIIDKMEVLSVGEKIRKLRVKNGVRLKDICSENLSISKISCIENNKIKADKASLKILAKKLGATYEYLSKDIPEQISENISSFDEEELSVEVFEKYKYNLQIAVKYEIYDLVFKICNRVFNKFIFEKDFSPYIEKIFEIIPIYFDSLLKVKDISKEIIYNLDLAIYFLIRDEFGMAAYYFKFLRKAISNYKILKEYDNIITVCEANCYINLREYDNLYFIKEKIEIFNYENSPYSYDVKYFDSILNIKYNFEKFNTKNTFEEFKNCPLERKIEYLYKLSKILYELEHLKECIYFCEKLYSVLINNKFDNCRYKYLVCKSLVHISKVYVDNMKRNRLRNSIENALNLSIEEGYTDLIPWIYFYKSLFYMKKNEINRVNTYINLCMHFISVANRKNRNRIHLNLGFMFYELKDKYESIKNFNYVK